MRGRVRVKAYAKVGGVFLPVQPTDKKILSILEYALTGIWWRVRLTLCPRLAVVLKDVAPSFYMFVSSVIFQSSDY